MDTCGIKANFQLCKFLTKRNNLNDSKECLTFYNIITKLYQKQLEK